MFLPKIKDDNSICQTAGDALSPSRASFFHTSRSLVAHHPPWKGVDADIISARKTFVRNSRTLTTAKNLFQS